MQTVFEDIALDTAICRSPPICSFAGDKKELERPSAEQLLSMLGFY
jgi:hypothetical protein